MALQEEIIERIAAIRADSPAEVPVAAAEDKGNARDRVARHLHGRGAPDDLVEQRRQTGRPGEFIGQAGAGRSRCACRRPPRRRRKDRNSSMAVSAARRRDMGGADRTRGQKERLLSKSGRGDSQPLAGTPGSQRRKQSGVVQFAPGKGQLAFQVFHRGQDVARPARARASSAGRGTPGAGPGRRGRD